MPYGTLESEFDVTLEPAETVAATVTLLHGLGADGWDFVPIVGELELTVPVRFIFPHAPARAVTVNAGYVMRAWYDIKSFTPDGRADASGLAESVQRTNRYLEAEIKRDMAADRIVLAGFSQGGAVALSAGLQFAERLAVEKSSENSRVPILMCHGRIDPVVPIAMGIEARNVLQAQGYAIEWREYAMGHELCVEELAEIGQWLRGFWAASHRGSVSPRLILGQRLGAHAAGPSWTAFGGDAGQHSCIWPWCPLVQPSVGAVELLKEPHHHDGTDHECCNFHDSSPAGGAGVARCESQRWDVAARLNAAVSKMNCGEVCAMSDPGGGEDVAGTVVTLVC